MASTRVTKQLSYNDITICINGREFTPKDAAGNVVEPFIMNGTTYLPVRAVGEALGLNVNWDGDTHTVYLGDIDHLPYQVNNATLYDGTKDTSFSVAGKVCKTGVVLKTLHDYGSNYDGSAIWNTEGYETMTFTVGHVGSGQRNATLYVSLDGVAAGEYELTWDGSPKTITVSLNGSPNVKLTLINSEVIKNYGSAAETYGVYDVKLAE